MFYSETNYPWSRPFVNHIWPHEINDEMLMDAVLTLFRFFRCLGHFPAKKLKYSPLRPILTQK